jgi:hypothetical protein
VELSSAFIHPGKDRIQCIGRKPLSKDKQREDEENTIHLPNRKTLILGTRIRDKASQLSVGFIADRFDPAYMDAFPGSLANEFGGHCRTAGFRNTSQKIAFEKKLLRSMIIGNEDDIRSAGLVPKPGSGRGEDKNENSRDNQIVLPGATWKLPKDQFPGCRAGVATRPLVAVLHFSFTLTPAEAPLRFQ